MRHEIDQRAMAHPTLSSFARMSRHRRNLQGMEALTAQMESGERHGKRHFALAGWGSDPDHHSSRARVALTWP
jgi:hypothetical protein